MRILLENCSLIDNSEEYKYSKGNYIGISDDIISYIGKEKPAEKFDVVKNINDNFVIPGLYNCHTHAAMVLLRGIGSDLPLDKWLFEKVFPIEDRLQEKEIKVGTDLAIMEMLSCGTVSFSDMYFFPEITAESVLSSGIKANLCRPVQCFDPSEKPEDSYRIKESLELFDKYNNKGNGRLLIDFCIHAEYTCDEKTTAYYSALFNEKSGNLHIHMSETMKEHNECIAKYGKTPAQWFSDLGAFESRAFAAHCVAITDEDIALMKNKGVSVVHNPSSNMKLGSGFADIQKYIDSGLNVALGTDGAASNNNLDILEEMHLASLIHNGYKNDPTIMNADTIIKMATVNGAKLQGREDAGELKIGNKADMVVLSANKPHMHPCLDLPALITYSAQSSDVVMTMVDGKILYENGEYKTIDAEKVLYDFDKTVKKLYS